MPVVDANSPQSRGTNKEIVSVVADTTINAYHLGRLLRVDSSSTVTLTLPRNLPAGAWFEVEQVGAGVVVFAAATGATLVQQAAGDRTAAQYARATCEVTAQTAATGLAAVWNLSGDLTSSTVAELNLLDNTVASVSWAVTAGAANICILTGTIKDAAGATIAASRPLLIYISEASTGIGITADSYSTGAAITTGTSLVALTANKAWLINTHTNGTFAISITDTAKPADQRAVAINWTTGQLSISAASGVLWG